MLIPEECFFDGRFYTTGFIRKVVKFQFWRDCVPDKSSSVSEFLGWETRYQQGRLSFETTETTCQGVVEMGILDGCPL